jgi:hypothetical protein
LEAGLLMLTANQLQQGARSDRASAVADQEGEDEDEEDDDYSDRAGDDVSSTDSSDSPVTSPRSGAQEPRYNNLHSFVAMMRGQRDHTSTHDVSNEGEDFLEAVIGFFSSPFVSMWDTIHP